MCHSWLWLKEELFPPFLLLFRIEDRLKKKTPSTLRSLDEYQDEPLAGEDTESVEDQLDVDGLSPRTLQDRYKNTVTVYSW